MCESLSSSGAVVIGIGNLDRGDDGVGRIVARLLRSHLGTQVVEQDGEATALLAVLQPVDRAWLIDAAESGAPAGTIHRIDCTISKVPPRGNFSSHGFGVAEAVELARTLGTLPQHCVVYAIEAADFTHGAAVSPPVMQAANEVAELILAELTQPPP